jgi:phage terminase large subunit-like protein
LGFKSYAEGRANFQGTAKHLIHFDEEPALDVYVEALLRTMVVPGASEGGIMHLTFTPIEGWTDVVEAFLGADRERKEELSNA